MENGSLKSRHIAVNQGPLQRQIDFKLVYFRATNYSSVPAYIWIIKAVAAREGIPLEEALSTRIYIEGYVRCANGWD